MAAAVAGRAPAVAAAVGRPAVAGVGKHGPLPPRVADGRQAEGHRARPADDRGRGSRLRPRGRDPEDRGAADEPGRRRAPAACRSSARPGATWASGERHAAGGRSRAGPRPRRLPDRAPTSGLPADPTLADRLAEARRSADAHRDHGERRAPRGPTGWSGDRRPARWSRPSAARARSRSRTRSPRTTCSSGLRLDQRIPGLVDGYFGPAALKAAVDMEQLRAPGPAARGRARARATAWPREVGEPDRRTGSTPSSSRSRRRPPALAGDAAAVRGARRPLHGVRAAAPRRRGRSTRPCATLDARLPGDGPLARPARGLGSAPRDPGRSAAGRRRLARRAVPRRAPRPLRAARRRGPARLARHATSRGPATTGSTAAGAPGSTSTPTCRSGRRTSSTRVAHETYPGHHLEHAWKEAELVDRLGRLEASILLINTPECLDQRGPGRPRRVVRRTARGARRPAGRSCSSEPGWPWPAIRSTAREAAELAVAPSLRPAHAARGHPRQRGVPAPRRRRARTTRSSTYLREVGGYAPDGRRQAARVHRASAVADVRLRLRRGRGAAPAVDGGGARARAGRAVRPPPPRAGHAGSTPRGAGLTFTVGPGRPASQAIANPAVAPARTASVRTARIGSPPEPSAAGEARAPAASRSLVIVGRPASADRVAGARAAASSRSISLETSR